MDAWLCLFLERDFKQKFLLECARASGWPLFMTTVWLVQTVHIRGKILATKHLPESPSGEHP